MPQGKIKKLVADKGFGFISSEHGDVFFHCSVVEDVTFDQLREGQEVDFTLDPDSPRSAKKSGDGKVKGPRANLVVPA